MAVTPAPTSANQTAYLNGLVKSGGGNGEWAKAQLGTTPQVNQTPSSGVGISSAPQAATPKPILGGLTQAQLTAMGEGIKSLGPNFGTGASQTPTPQANSLTPNAAPSTPAPLSATPPKTDYAGIASARIAAQRAALAGSVAAYDTSRKSAFDYMTKNTQDQRVLDDAMFQENNNPFSGKYAYDKTNILRNNNIQDTQNQANYQNDISASDAKLAAFDAGSAGQQQDIMDQLQQRDFQNNIAQAPYTGQLNGQQTQQAQAQGFNQNLQSNQFNQQAQNQGFNQNMQTQQFAYTQARDAIKDKQYQQQFDMDNQKYGLDYALKQATLNNQITNDQAQRAIGYMNANISQQNANTASASQANTAANDSARLSWEKDPTNPANIYRGAQTSKDNAQADNIGNKAPSKNSLDSTYVNNLNTMTPDKRDSFFKNEKSNIINDLGISGYNQLYSMYYDQYGAPKQ